LHADLKACGANGCAFGRFANELRRLLILWRKAPHHAAKVKDFAPDRLVGWLQDELTRFHADRQEAENKAAAEEGRKHYEKLDGMAIARRNVERRLGTGHNPCAHLARFPDSGDVDKGKKLPKTVGA
jgi:hypothetical protein